MDNIEKFGELWDGSDTGWGLIRTEPGKFVAYHKSGRARLIESEEIASQVHKKMIESGCEIWDDIPGSASGGNT